MRVFRRIVFILAAVVSSAGIIGCSMMPHFMQPSQLQKWNRGSNGTPSSDYFD